MRGGKLHAGAWVTGNKELINIGPIFKNGILQAL